MFAIRADILDAAAHHFSFHRRLLRHEIRNSERHVPDRRLLAGPGWPDVHAVRRRQTAEFESALFPVIPGNTHPKQVRVEITALGITSRA